MDISRLRREFDRLVGEPTLLALVTKDAFADHAEPGHGLYVAFVERVDDDTVTLQQAGPVKLTDVVRYTTVPV